ncbi:MAG: hypothetical protein CVV48_15120 [Spirochaetae bacterium HGW-Spirochaetae-4]|nr:MAG: hypothetical protein CVV48_15120 [Spirochaetae bacterium HGW-Spirochaetae-4]
MDMKKLRAGVFGFGDVAVEYVKALRENSHVDVAAIVGHDPIRTREKVGRLGIDIKVLDTFEQMVQQKDIDIIVITSPHFMHAQETMLAAQAGKHIICEKPIGMDFQEMKRVHKAVKAAGVQFQCGMVLRWNPYIETLKNMIGRGMFGDIFYMEFDYFHKLTSAWNGFSWGGQNRSGGPSASLVAGIHAVDLMRYLGGEVEDVYANGTCGHRTDFEYPPTYIATLKFKNGAVGKTSCSFETESPYLVNSLIHGSKGSVVQDRFFTKEIFPGQTGWQKFETIMPDSGAVSHHPFRFLVNDFIDAIVNERPSMLNIDETYKTHELCMAIDTSIATNGKVTLPLA